MRGLLDNSVSMKKERLTDKPDLSTPISGSKIYQDFLAEKEEVLKHKWLESEKARHDIGYERAAVDWIMNHREKWRADRRSKQ